MLMSVVHKAKNVFLRVGPAEKRSDAFWDYYLLPVSPGCPCGPRPSINPNTGDRTNASCTSGSERVTRRTDVISAVSHPLRASLLNL